MPKAYYNEFDPKKAAWLRELINRDIIAPGDVDERDINDIRADDLAGYTQCHFFAGIGIWSYALRLAGWGDNEPVWTGSCPCQPFSVAGRKEGFADSRHLFPTWSWLIKARNPVVVFGEQVASRDGLAWFDSVREEMDDAGYTVGCVDSCAAGFGAPHIRQRLYWVADRWSCSCPVCQTSYIPCWMANLHGSRPQGRRVGGDSAGERVAGPGGVVGGIQHSTSDGREQWGTEPGGRSVIGRCGSVNGFWSDAVWLPCKDGRQRPTEPGTFPLAHGAAQRVLRLRGYGDGIVAPQAVEFIKAYRAVRAEMELPVAA